MRVLDEAEAAERVIERKALHNLRPLSDWCESIVGCTGVAELRKMIRSRHTAHKYLARICSIYFGSSPANIFDICRRGCIGRLRPAGLGEIYPATDLTRLGDYNCAPILYCYQITLAETLFVWPLFKTSLKMFGYEV